MISSKSVGGFLDSLGQEVESHSSSGSKDYATVLSKEDNLGTWYVRMVPDANGIPIRALFDTGTVWIPKLTADGKIAEGEKASRLLTIPNIDYYANATEENKKLYETLWNYIDQAEERELLEPRNRATTYLFYAKPVRFIKPNGDIQDFGVDEPVRLFQHNSKAFVPALNETRKLKSAIPGAEDVTENFISRDPTATRNLIGIMTKPKDIGYTVSINFETLSTGTGIPLSSADLERASNLYEEDPDTTNFPTESFEEAIKVIKLMIEQNDAEMREETGAVPSFNTMNPVQMDEPPAM